MWGWCPSVLACPLPDTFLLPDNPIWQRRQQDVTDNGCRNFACCPPDAPEEPDKPRRKLNFRRLLLNKCQEEFEKGDVAMAAVAAREKKKADGGEEEDKVIGSSRTVCLCLFFGGGHNL